MSPLHYGFWPPYFCSFPRYTCGSSSSPRLTLLSPLLLLNSEHWAEPLGASLVPGIQQEPAVSAEHIYHSDTENDKAAFSRRLVVLRYSEAIPRCLRS